MCEQALPATIAGIRRYLGSGLVRGIGPRLAERIVAHFGAATLQVIENQPERLQQVPDIGPKRVRMIAQAWQEQRQVKEIMLFLHSYGVSTNLAVKIYKQYGDQAMHVVQSDPYRLSRDIFGVGFKTADRIAQSLGLAADHPSRIEAGLVFALQELVQDGHVFAPRTLLSERAVELLAVDPGLIDPALQRLAAGDRIFLVDLPLPAGKPELSRYAAPSLPGETPLLPAVYLAALYQAETGVTAALQSLMNAFPTRLSDLPPMFCQPRPAAFPRAASRHPHRPQPAAQRADRRPGHRQDHRPARPDRRAHGCPQGLRPRLPDRACRQAPLSSYRAHRFHHPSPARLQTRRGIQINPQNPLPVDLLVVDEASMLDLQLTIHLLKAVQPGTHLLLVGDVDQLPSVGAGDVLRDLIASGLAPVTRLSVIFRQAAGSHIITNAHRINQGQAPLFAKDSSDFFLFPAETAEEAGDWVQQLVCERIPARSV